MTDTQTEPQRVGIDVETAYLAEHSRPALNQYAFAYTITISNGGDVPVQLLSRHWIITDADGQVQQVRGEGVVGEQPVIAPGRAFRYTSGATLSTPVGCMEGSYFMVVREGGAEALPARPEFEVPIPPFTLSKPNSLN